MEQAKRGLSAFRVSATWIAYAHGPASESGHLTAAELIALAQRAEGDAVLIPANRADLVREIVDVAALYTGDSNVQHDERLWFRSYPANVIRRGKKWLAEAATPTRIDMSEQRERIAKVIAEQLGIDLHHITPEKRFDADLGADSLDAIELVITLEHEFAIDVEDERAEKVVTVGDAFDLIAELTARRI